MPLPASSNYLTDNEDLLWHLKTSVNWDELVRLMERDFTLPDGPGDVEKAKERYLAILEEVGRFVANEVAPHVEKVDEHGTYLEDGKVVMAPESEAAFAGLKDMGLHGLTLPRELG